MGTNFVCTATAMKILTVFVFCALNLSHLNATTLQEENKEIIMLLNERQQLFDNYSKSLQKKSGIFGKRTKNDIRFSEAELKEIVRIDNKIVSRLQQMLSYKKIEGQTMNYDMHSYESRINSLTQMADTLHKQVQSLERQLAEAEKDRKSSNRKYYGLLLMLILLGIYRLYRSFRLKGKA